MSSPTTPARSIVRSAFSTPSTAQYGTSPQELTPRSRVKAMLAAIDDESDSASEAAPKAKGLQRIALAPVVGNVRMAEVQKKIEYESDNGGEEEEDDDDDGPIVPRGRLAAQLNGQSIKSSDSGSSNWEDGDEDAYKRIKKRLLRKDARKARETASGSETDAVRSKTTNRASPSSHRKTSTSSSDHGFSQRKSPIRNRRSSPDLFVTPEIPSGRNQSPIGRPATNDGSDSDLPANPQTNSRFLELVARKRAEREANQAEEVQKKAEKAAKQQSFQKQLSRDASSESDEEVAGRRLTQQARPTRKASKKALEEMNRETQRMSRNMQLAHQAKTKKKITKDSLFARFNFRTATVPNVEAPQNPGSSTAASSAPVSELEDNKDKESPPTSPAGPDNVMDVDKESTPLNAVVEHARSKIDKLPSMHDILTQPTLKLDKGKGKAVEETKLTSSPDSNSKRSKKKGFTQPPIKVRPQKPSLPKKSDLESDSDLEIMPNRKTKKPRMDVFDRLPAGKFQDARSLQTLRALAHLNSPEKQRHSKKATMSLTDMQTLLQRRARQQALEERAAKMEDLKSRGIIVQTAEERQQDLADVEDLLEKARREGEEIKQKEKRAAKREKIANGEVDDLPDTSDEDEDYQEEGEGDEPEIELSGSEEEYVEIADGADGLASDAEESPDEDEEDGESALDKEEPGNNGLIDNEASENGDDEDEEDGIVDDDIEEDEGPPDLVHQRPRRSKMVIVDDDDEDVDDDDEDKDEIQDTLNAIVIQKPAIEVPIFPLGLESSKLIDVPMGMTQAFAATMADTQGQADEVDDEQDSLAFLGPPPEPNFPMFDVNDSPQMIEDSQTGLQYPNAVKDQDANSYKDIELNFSQSQIRYDAFGDTQAQPTATQVSEIPDPTQDVGFTLSSPAPERFVSVPPSTVDTVLLSGAADNESPIKKRRGRLQRGAVIHENVSDLDEVLTTSDGQDAERDVPTNAFEAMKKAGKKDLFANNDFDKKKSEAKTMVEEQAQESEDEYAGLGGASDDESGGEEDEFVREMIDREEVNVDENQLAAFYANKERTSDEKAVEKLFKDINSGMLRRKRGAEFDISDSEDDAEARQRRKRREFAKMRKALLENENVGKIAEDPKKLAFLRAIEDREDDEDLDFLDRPAEDSFRTEVDTQEEADSQPQQPTLPGPALGKRKRPLQESIPDKANMRPPPAARRTAASKKPATLAEIRESVSFLIEEPGSINIAPDPSSSASEDEGNHSENRQSNPRRRLNPKPIIDRLSLKRAESASTSSPSRLAFHDPSSNSSIGGFKVPSLLRRATTSNLDTNAADANGISTAAATERAAGGGEKGDFVRKGGTKRSSVNYFSREAEKRGVVEGVERRRKEDREREARKRRSGLGSLGVGAFE